MEIPIRGIPPILTPLAREDAFTRRVRWHWRNAWVTNQGELAGLVEPGAAPGAGGEELVHEWGVDNTDYGTVIVDESDGDAEHGEYVCVVDGSYRKGG
jgi:hypothetical protein